MPTPIIGIGEWPGGSLSVEIGMLHKLVPVARPWGAPEGIGSRAGREKPQAETTDSVARFSRLAWFFRSWTGHGASALPCGP